jgi:hypothetical protein
MAPKIPIIVENSPKSFKMPHISGKSLNFSLNVLKKASDFLKSLRFF